MKLKSYFTSDVRERGAVYFRLKQISYRLVGGFAAHAKVKGGETYSCSLLIDQAKGKLQSILTLECDCPHFLSAHPCKHLWCFILAIEGDAWATSISEARNLQLDFSYPDDAVENAGRARTRLDLEQPVVSRSLSWEVFKKRIHPTPSSIRPIPSDIEFPIPSPLELVYVLDTQVSLESGDLALRFYAREQGKSGKWSPYRPVSLHSELRRDFSSIEDRQIFRSLLRDCDGFKNGQSSGYFKSRAIVLTHRREGMDGVLLPASEALRMCSMVASKGKLFLIPEGSKRLLPQPLGVSERAWNLEVSLVEHDEMHFALQTVIAAGDDTTDLESFTTLADGRFGIFDSTLHPFTLHENRHQDWLTQLTQDIPVVFAKKDFDAFVVEYARFPNAPSIRWPEGFSWTEIGATPRPKLRLSPYYFAGQETLAGEVIFQYPQEDLNSLNSIPSWVDETLKTITLRDFSAEQSRLGELAKLPAVHAAIDGDLIEEGKTFFILPENLAEVVERLEDLGWEVEVGAKRVRLLTDFDVVAHGETDWFDLSITTKIEAKTYHIPELLRNLPEDEVFIPLGGGELALLPQEWRDRFEILKKSGSIEEESFRIPSQQVLFIDSLLAEMSIDNRSAQLRTIREKIRSFKVLQPVEAPATFVGELRDYQKEGLAWLEFLQDFGFGGCLSDEMGLGKTIQVLAMLLRFHEDGGRPPSLIVVPRSLVSNWISEAAKFCPALRMQDMSTPSRDWDASKNQQPQLIVTTYGLLRQDIKELSLKEFSYVVLDESQVIKNPNSQAARASRLLKARYRLAMSGTPVENHMRELMSLMRFLNPGLLDNHHWTETFRKKFDADDPSFKTLIAAMRPLMLRRSKQQVLKDLPAKVEDVLYCDLEGEQRKHYDELRVHYQMNLLPKLQDESWKQSSIVVIEALLRLRQAACHPALIDPRFNEVSSAKLEALRDKLQEIILSGRKALIFSQFTSFLKILASQLKGEGIAFEYLDGGTRDRAARVERFQTDPRIPLFLISLKAGGVGLNLTAADYCFILDPWWNPAAEAQAIDRAHRIHQKNTVFAYRIIARDTVEEKIQALQKSKRDMVAHVLDGEGSLLNELDLKSIRSLFL